jgi:hypothetical protein
MFPNITAESCFILHSSELPCGHHYSQTLFFFLFCFTVDASKRISEIVLKREESKSGDTATYHLQKLVWYHLLDICVGQNSTILEAVLLLEYHNKYSRFEHSVVEANKNLLESVSAEFQIVMCLHPKADF